MKLTVMKEKMMKFIIIMLVCLSLSSGPAAGNEVTKMLECLSGARDAKLQELDAEEEESGELLKLKQEKE